MERPRRKSFYVAKELITKIVEYSNQPSQSISQDLAQNTKHRASRRNTTQPPQPNNPNVSNSSKQRAARRQTRLVAIDDQEFDQNRRRTRSKSTHCRDTSAESQQNISSEINNNENDQRRKQPKRTQNRNQAIESKSTNADASSSTKKKGRQPNRLNGIEQRDTSNNDNNGRRTRSKSIHDRNTIAAHIDAPELNDNGRQTRSKSAQRRNTITTRQAEPPQSPNQMNDEPEAGPSIRPYWVNDEPELIVNDKNESQKPHSKKKTAAPIENRRNTIATGTVYGRDVSDVVNFQPASQIFPTRDFSIRLDRLNPETINRYLKQNRSKPVRRPSIVRSKPILCNSKAAKRIINRRCTVAIDRIQLTQDEPHSHHDVVHQSQPVVIAGKSFERSVDSGFPIDIDRVESSGDNQSEVSTFYESEEDRKMSSDISVQNQTVSQPLLTHARVASVQDDIELFNSEQMDIVDEISDISSCHSKLGTRHSVGMSMDDDADDDADDEDDPRDNASTYCSGIPALTLINVEQMLLSQTSKYHNWNYDRSSSVNSTDVEVDAAETNTQFRSGCSQATSNKCFIDSPHVSYGEFITYGNETFSVNCLDHENESIRHHFLSKFSSDHIHALNTYFRGNLWVTEVTARLYQKYSNIMKRQVKVLQYYQRTMVGKVYVTPVEAPNFPGGALFLFEAPGEKTIIHAGDLRLHTEITENEFLMKTNIDEVRFDKTMLSRVFHCFPLCTDRYVSLKAEIGNFCDANQIAGLRNLIAVGAFEIGMESFLYELAICFNSKIYMPEAQRKFLDQLVAKSPNELLVQLKRHVVDDQKAMIHVLKVDEISNEFLMNYISHYNCHRVLGIRPRGCDKALGIVVDGAHKIYDVANPLIGDISEYERFVVLVIEKSMTKPREPADHANGNGSGSGSCGSGQSKLQLVRKN